MIIGMAKRIPPEALAYLKSLGKYGKLGGKKAAENMTPEMADIPATASAIMRRPRRLSIQALRDTRARAEFCRS